MPVAVRVVVPSSNVVDILEDGVREGVLDGVLESSAPSVAVPVAVAVGVVEEVPENDAPADGDCVPVVVGVGVRDGDALGVGLADERTTPMT